MISRAIQWEGNVASTGEKMKIATFFLNWTTRPLEINKYQLLLLIELVMKKSGVAT